jgi:hypothetical protein
LGTGFASLGNIVIAWARKKKKEKRKKGEEEVIMGVGKKTRTNE